MAVKVQSRLSQSSGPTEAAPVMVSVAPVSETVAAKLAAVAALEAVSVPEAVRGRAPDSLRGRAKEGAGDAHVVVVGRADAHHQVGGRAQPVPAAEGVASPRRQRVGAHNVPGKGAQGHGVALQLEASHREAGRGDGALAVGAHQKFS